jgi:hypothetical protein
MKLLNLGCGRHYHPYWINFDFNSSESEIIAHNLMQGIPFEDNFFNVPYHLPIFIKDCYFEYPEN